MVQKLRDLSEAEKIPGGYREVTQCRACGSGRLITVLSLGTQFVVDFVKEANPLLPKAPLELMLCDACDLLQLSVSVDPNLLWRGNYWYRSSVNDTMRRALSDVVNNGCKYHDGGVWIDIGANDGFLLSKVPNGFRKVGIEPSATLIPLLEEHADTVVNDFFRIENCPVPNAQVITSCACFYDVDDPNKFCADVAKLLSNDGVWINQFTGADEMVKATAFDGICHEHRCYYTLPSLQRLYHQNGLKIVDVSWNDVNGGSVRVTAKKGSQVNIYQPLSRNDIYSFARRVKKWQANFRWLIDELHGAGKKIYGVAASTKGTALLQYVDRPRAITAVSDRNPVKHGLKMVGTWTPICDEQTLRDARPDVLLCLAWSFKDEIVERERETLERGALLLFPLPSITAVL